MKFSYLELILLGFFAFQVKVGAHNYFIGYLQYKSYNPDADKLDYLIIIIIAASVFLVLIVVICILATLGCRKARKAKVRKREANRRLIKTVSGDSSASTGRNFRADNSSKKCPEECISCSSLKAENSVEMFSFPVLGVHGP